MARLVLLSERGKNHGSIWGVPPFLEGVLKAMIVVTVTGVATATNTIATPRPSSPSPQPQGPSPPAPSEPSRPPLNCTAVLQNPAKKGDPDWCSCARQHAPEEYEEYIDICVPGVEHVCLTIYVEPCCSEDTSDACLNSWSASRGAGECAAFKRSELRKGVTKQLSGSWRASWSLKDGWRYAGWGISSSIGKGISCSGSGGGGSASGTCSATVPPSAFITITIVFMKESSTTTTTTTTTRNNPSSPSSGGGGSSSSGGGSSGSGSGSGGSNSSSGSSGGSSSNSSQPSQQQPQPQPQPSYPSDPTQQNNSRPPDYSSGSGGGGGGPGVPKFFT